MTLWMAFDIVGTIAFAVSGVFLGIKKRMDIFGVLILAIITAVGGGIMRDVLLGNTPPVAFKDPTFILISIVTTLIASFVYTHVKRYNNIIQIADAIGLGSFAVTGAVVAMNNMNTLFVTIFISTLTGIGGGVLRDVLAQEIPFVFRKEVYAVACIIGATVFYYSNLFLPLTASMYLCFIVTVVIRLFSIKYDIHLPKINPR